MKKTILTFMVLLGYLCYSQEGFEGSWPPPGWTVQNVSGPLNTWEQATDGTATPAYQGTHAAYLNKEMVTAGTYAEDWLITNPVTIPANGQIRFFSRLTIAGDQGSTYKLMINNNPDTFDDISAYSDLLSTPWTETQINPVQQVYTEKIVSIPASYYNTTARIAFVMLNNNGDRWLIDNVNVVSECFVPTALTTTGITGTTATISWAAGGSETQWEVEVFPATGTVPESGTIVTSASYPVTGLSIGTSYIYRIRAVCDTNNTSAWVQGTFSTVGWGNTCETAINVLPSQLPYSAADNTLNHASQYFTGSPGSSCGSTSGYLNGAETVYSYTPAENEVISISATNLTATYAGLFVYDSCSNIGVNCYAGDTNPGSTADLTVTELSVTAGTTYYILIGTWSPPASVGYTINIQKENCAKPTNLSMTNVSTDSVSFQWTEAGTATSWEYVVQQSGLGIPTTGGIATTETNGSATNLNPSTAYEVYVRAQCEPGGAEYSSWAGPITFNTACSTLSVPFTEGFNSTSATEQCWTVVNENADALTWNLNTTYFMYEGNQVASLTKYWNSTTNNDWLISPGIQLTGNQRLRFQYRVVSASYPTDLEVLLSTGGVATSSFTTTLMPQQTISNAAYQEKIIYLDDYTGAINFAFHVPQVSTNSWTIFIDQVIVEDIPACPDPVDLTATNFTDTSVTLNWTPGYQETQWDVVLQPQGTGTPTGNGTLVSTNSYNAENLQAATYYEYYVRAHCSDTENSNWVGPYSFNTLVCNPENMCNYTFDIQATSGSGTFSKILVTQNGVQVGSISANALNNTGTVAMCPDVPFTLTWDTTYWNSYTQEVTVTNPFDEVVYNWIKNVTPVSTPFFQGTPVCSIELCPKPQEVTLTNQQQTSLTVDWTEIGSATQWEIYLVPEGGDAPSDATSGTIVASHPYTIENLNPGTVYSVYVRSVCGGDNGSSTWTAEETYSTLVPNDNCENAVVLSVSNTGYCEAPYHATLNLATASAQGNICGDASFANDDVWFEFTATSASQILYINNRAGSNLNLNKVVYSGSCDNLQQVVCSEGIAYTDGSINNNIALNNNDILLENLTVGETYKIRVFSNAATAATTQFDICIATPANPIGIDQTTYTAEQLVTNVFASENCAQISNVNTSTGTNYGAPYNGIGYFTANNSGFAFNNGIILSTGQASAATGYKTFIQSYNFYNQTAQTDLWLGDQDLLDYMVASGVDSTIENYYNASVVEFDFMPFGNQLNFNFLFSSEDYGNFQCEWADAFAFLLTDENGNTTNLAVVPGATTPISVVTVRDNQYNPDCDSENAEYFDRVFDGRLGDSRYGSSNRFYGNTLPFAVNAAVNPGHQYHIKMVIAEKNDGNFDSAIFLDGSSFNTGQLSLGNDMLVSTNTALCEGADTVLDTHLNGAYFGFQWSKDGNEITGATSATYTVSQPGNYSVVATFNASGCTTSAAVTVEYYDNTLNLPQDLEQCSLTSEATFNLTENTAVVLSDSGTDGYNVSYYATLEAANSGDASLAIEDATAYVSGNATVYVKIDNAATGCSFVYPFNITVTPSVNAVLEFSYNEDFCTLNTTELTPVYAEGFLSGGTFSANSADVIVNPETGVISIADSQYGTYTITYTLPSFDCTMGGSYAVQVVITEPQIPVTQFSYAQACILTNTAVPALADGFTSGGIFTATGISVDAQTGVVTLNDASTGSYEITYTVQQNAELCIAAASYSATIEVVDVIAPQIAFEYTNPSCADAVSAAPVLSEGFVTGGIFTADASLDIDPDTGIINVQNSASGTYTVSYDYINAENCQEGTSTAQVIILVAPQFNLGGPYTSCVASNITIEVADANFNTATAQYSWTLNGEGLDNQGASVTASGFGVYVVTATTADGCVTSQSTVLTQDTTAVALAVEQGCDNNSGYTLSVSDINGSFSADTATVSWSGPDGFTSSETTVQIDIKGTYTVTVTTPEGCVGEQTLEVSATNCFIPRGISPNGDGLNDSFDLTNLDVRKLEIFNRYGKEVYKFTGAYTNQWRGQTSNGEELPTGTYFYMIEYTNGESKTGWVYINK